LYHTKTRISRLPDLQTLDFVEHVLVMCGGPVNAPASGTPKKFFLRRKNVRRH
jgi:hypothetical protein